MHKALVGNCVTMPVGVVTLAQVKASGALCLGTRGLPETRTVPAKKLTICVKTTMMIAVFREKRGEE